MILLLNSQPYKKYSRYLTNSPMNIKMYNLLNLKEICIRPKINLYRLKGEEIKNFIIKKEQ